MRRDLDRLFERMWSGFGSGPFTYPHLGVEETGDSLTVTAELPEMNPEDLDITVTENTLVLRGRSQGHKREETEGVHRLETTIGGFARTLKLGKSIQAENVEATFEDGLLRIIMPKKKIEKRGSIKVAVKG